jgi:hypothetical protein
LSIPRTPAPILNSYGGAPNSTASVATSAPGVKLTDISWPVEELPSRSKRTSTVNTAPDWTSEGAFAIEYEGTANALPGWAATLTKASAATSFCRSFNSTLARFAQSLLFRLDLC